MVARATASGTISFGLVSIPIKLFTAAASEQVHFNLLAKDSGSRLKQQYVSAASGEIVERSEMVKGYEYARGQFVTFTEEELKALEAERKNSIEILEFVPEASVDLVHIEKSYYVGPDKGGDRAYQLLSETMREEKRLAVGQWAARGKEQLVLIRPYGKGGLILHQLYYANEVRKFDEIDTGATFTFSDVEKDLARKLIAQLSADAFDPSKYRDVYADRIQEAVDKKVAGQEVTVVAEQPKAQIVDLFEALKRSLASAGSNTNARSEPGAPGPARAAADGAGAADEEGQSAAPAKPPKKATPRRTRAAKASGE